MTRIALPLALLFVATGCPQTTTCTTEARSSVTLTVVDDAGTMIEDATATYTVDGGAEADCEAMTGNELVCGWEEEGDFSIVVSAPGYGATTVTATVGADECHVITEVVEAVVSPIACTDEEVVSVEVNVTDETGEAITDATVEWNIAEEDDLPEPCMSVGGNTWQCAYETAGDLRIDVSKEGYTSFSEVVTVGSDECHVITETVDAELVAEM